MTKVKSDIEIARAAKMKPIKDVLARISVPDDPASFSPMGRHIAKLNLEYIDKLKEKNSNLILVTAITPTPAGEGKTTTSVGLNDGLNKIGKKSIVCLREPSLGPSFGLKGGAAGGGPREVLAVARARLGRGTPGRRPLPPVRDGQVCPRRHRQRPIAVAAQRQYPHRRVNQTRRPAPRPRRHDQHLLARPRL